VKFVSPSKNNQAGTKKGATIKPPKKMHAPKRLKKDDFIPWKSAPAWVFKREIRKRGASTVKGGGQKTSRDAMREKSHNRVDEESIHEVCKI